MTPRLPRRLGNLRGSAYETASCGLAGLRGGVVYPVGVWRSGSCRSGDALQRSFRGCSPDQPDQQAEHANAERSDAGRACGRRATSERARTGPDGARERCAEVGRSEGRSHHEKRGAGSPESRASPSIGRHRQTRFGQRCDRWSAHRRDRRHWRPRENKAAYATGRDGEYRWKRNTPQVLSPACRFRGTARSVGPRSLSRRLRYGWRRRV
jgi:hypothetical protein